MPNISSLEVRLLQKFIKDKCGIEIVDEKAYLIEGRLARILAESRLSSFGELYCSVYNSNDERLTQKLIDAITTNETFWFRDKTPWRIIEDLYMPRYLDMLRSGKKNKVRIWSAAASTGQEAYSTAICIDKYLRSRYINDVNLDRFEILGTDISYLALEIAKNGRYNNVSIMRGLDSSLKDSYFKERGTVWEINDEIKQAVTFKQFNLQNTFVSFEGFDVIFCRYVLIYFSDELKNDIVNKMYNILNDDGVLFVGAYEMYGDLSLYFNSKLYEDGTFYVKAKIEGG